MHQIRLISGCRRSRRLLAAWLWQRALRGNEGERQKHAGELGTPGWGRGEHSREASATRTEPGEVLEGNLLKTRQLLLRGYFQGGVRGALCSSPASLPCSGWGTLVCTELRAVPC